LWKAEGTVLADLVCALVAIACRARALIRRTKQASRRRFPAEEKIRMLLEGIPAEISVAELCRREGIHPTVYYTWLKDFMEAGGGPGPAAGE
jgi:transposase-like protein